MEEVAFSDIVEAAKALEGVIVRTPVVNSAKIDEIAGRKVFMKCENAQHVKAFKFRGASNAVRVLGDAAEDGLCTHSSGCLLYTSPSPRDRVLSRMPSSA